MNNIGLTIPLGIYTLKAKAVLENFICNYLYSTILKGVDYYSWDEHVISFSQAPNGEICLNIVKESDWRIKRSSWRTRYSVMKAKKFLIYSIEKACKRMIEYARKDIKLEWNINCDTKLDSYQRYAIRCYDWSYRKTHITIGDLKAMLETMLGRKHMIKKITNEQREILIGRKRNPIETELEIARLEEVKRITDDYHNERNRLEVDKSNEYNVFYKQLDEKYNALKNIAKEKYEQRLAEVNKITQLT